jgi:hypothetical protein
MLLTDFSKTKTKVHDDKTDNSQVVTGKLMNGQTKTFNFVDQFKYFLTSNTFSMVIVLLVLNRSC